MITETDSYRKETAMPVIGFIGTGNMGGALARAASRNENNTVILSNRHPEKAQLLAEEINASVSDNAGIALGSDYIFVGVKPQMAEEMFFPIKKILSERKERFVIVSMLAGTAIEKIQALAGDRYPVIRIMPNTPVSVGEGMILYTCSCGVSDEEEKGFLEAMKNAGKFIKLDERLIDAGSAVSGCGPAFAAMFIEALADGGVACGLPRKQALELAAQMMLGTARLILDGNMHPASVKDAVCSPGGTTIQGVRALEQSGFRSAAVEAVIAAYEKTLELR